MTSGTDAAPSADASQTGAPGDASLMQQGPPLDGGTAAGDAASDSPATDAASLPPAPTLTPSGPVTIKGQDGGVITGLKITSTTGDCVTIDSTYGFTLRASEIGPCAGNAVVVTGGGQITIEDSYIHPEHPPTQCCDTGDGIYATGTTSLSILGNVIAYGEANIEVQQTTGVTVTGPALTSQMRAVPTSTAVARYRPPGRNATERGRGPTFTDLTTLCAASVSSAASRIS